MTTTITLPFASKSLNAFNKLHWSERNKERERYQTLIWALLRQQSGNIPKHTGHVSIAIVRHAPRTLDYDNLVGGLKPVIDAIKQLGIIADDTPAVVPHRDYRQMKVPGSQSKTVITISDL